MANAEPQIIEVAPGIRTGLWHWQPPSPASIRRAVLILPALGVRAAAYRHLAQALNVHGLDVLALDLRGVGSSSVRASRQHDWGYQDLLD
ncbi:MAG: alpha/beta fold hydrolase, partial [Xanthomonadales bacterium]|nr:alpha/beta fold hydrolase [Xanthomonadales bacterium]